MKKTRLISLLIIICMIILPILSACSKNADNDENNITVILDWYINTNHAGLYVALDMGFFADRNLNVEIKEPGTDSTACDIVAAGSADFGISYEEEVTYARTAGNPQPVVAVATILEHNTAALASPSSKNIKSMKDFEGKIYGGYGSPVEEAIVKALMKKAGADSEKVEFVNLGMTDFLSAAESTVDISMIYCGWTDIEAEMRGITLDKVMLKDEDEALDFYTPIIISSEKYLKDHSDTAKKFLAAVAQGYKYCRDNPDEAAVILQKYASESDIEMLKKSMNYLSDKFCSSDGKFGYMEKARWDKFTQFCLDNNIIDKELDTSKAFTNDYLPQ